MRKVINLSLLIGSILLLVGLVLGGMTGNIIFFNIPYYIYLGITIFNIVYTFIIEHWIKKKIREYTDFSKVLEIIDNGLRDLSAEATMKMDEYVKDIKSFPERAATYIDVANIKCDVLIRAKEAGIDNYMELHELLLDKYNKGIMGKVRYTYYDLKICYIIRNFYKTMVKDIDKCMTREEINKTFEDEEKGLEKCKGVI